MEILRSEYRFKALARALTSEFPCRASRAVATPHSLVAILSQHLHGVGTAGLYQYAQAIAEELRTSRHIKFRHTNALELLANLFTGRGYQCLRTQFCDPFAFRTHFPEAKVSPPEVTVNVRHTFPAEFAFLPYAHEWAKAWDGAESTPDNAFFPPMPPFPETAYLDRYAFSLRRDWPYPNSKREHDEDLYDGHCAVIIKDADRRVASAFAWRWWGPGHTVGVGCCGMARVDNYWWIINFDIRPYRQHPSWNAGVEKLPVTNRAKAAHWLSSFLQIRPIEG